MPKVMIVDDDRTTVNLLSMLLELDGFQAVVVSRGADVLASAEQETPDIFLIDFHLVDMEGIEVIQKLRATPRFAKTPIVMASGLNVNDESKRAGANEFLVKPFDPSGLASLFNRLIANHSADSH